MIVRQFLTFAAIGAATTAVQYVLLLWLVHLGSDPVLASTTGYALGALLSYALNYRVTFRATVAHRRSGPRFGAMVLSALLLNYLLMAAQVYWLGLRYFAAQLITTALMLLWNFSVSRRWIFAGQRARS